MGNCGVVAGALRTVCGLAPGPKRPIELRVTAQRPQTLHVEVQRVPQLGRLYAFALLTAPTYRLVTALDALGK